MCVLYVCGLCGVVRLVITSQMAHGDYPFMSIVAQHLTGDINYVDRSRRATRISLVSWFLIIKVDIFIIQIKNTADRCCCSHILLI